MNLTQFSKTEYPLAQISQEPTHPLTDFGALFGPLDPVTLAFLSGLILGNWINRK